jgi:tRNA threonylcarbamoyladenosine biosynthesis protein TsaB
VQLLALESSTHLLSVALWHDGLVHEHRQLIPNAGSQYLLPWAKAVLAECGTPLSSLDAIAFGAGPGGFVGVRLACAVAQGLGIGLGVPVIGINTLEAISVSSGAANVYACMDARMGQVYSSACLVGEDGPEVVLAAGVYSPAEVPLPPAARWIGAGDGFAAHGEALRARLGNLLSEVRPDVSPTAATVAQIAALKLQRGEAGDAGSATPLYIRDAVALTTAERMARGGRR